MRKEATFLDHITNPLANARSSRLGLFRALEKDLAAIGFEQSNR